MQAARAAALALLALGLGTAPVAAQGPLRIVGGQGELGGEYQGRSYGYTDAPGSSGADYRAWLQVPVQGALFGPGLLAYRLTLRPTFVRQTLTAFPDAQHERQLNLSGSATLLGGRPVSLSAQASRVTSHSAGGFAADRDATSTAQAATLWLNARALPTQITYSRQTLDESWTNLDDATPIEVANLLRIWRLTATSSKLAVQAQRLSYDDQLRDADYVAWTAGATHTLRWGRGSRLVSAYEYADQSGAFAYHRRDWSERLRLQHSRRVATTYDYRQSSTGADTALATGRFFGAGTDVAVTRWLTLGAAGSRHVARRGELRDAVTSLTPRANLMARFPGGLQLSATGGVGYEWRQRSGDGGTVPVVDEAVTIPATRVATLAQPDVEPGTIVVRSADGAITYLEGPDYTVRTTGRFTDLIIPPGSRIADGSVVLVSYRFRAPPLGPENALRADLAASFGVRAVTVRHRRSVRSSRTAPGAADSSGTDFSEMATDLLLRTATPLGQVSLDATHRRRDRFAERATDYEVSGAFDLVDRGPIGWSAGGAWDRTVADGRRAEAWSAHTTVAFSISAALTARLTGGLLDLTQDASARQRQLTGTAEVRWRVAALDMDVRYAHHHQDYLTDRTTRRLSARVTRRF